MPGGQSSQLLTGLSERSPDSPQKLAAWPQAHLKFLPEASNTTAKCVGGGLSDSRLSSMLRKTYTTVVSCPEALCRRASAGKAKCAL